MQQRLKGIAAERDIIQQDERAPVLQPGAQLRWRGMEGAIAGIECCVKRRSQIVAVLMGGMKVEHAIAEGIRSGMMRQVAEQRGFANAAFAVEGDRARRKQRARSGGDLHLAVEESGDRTRSQSSGRGARLRLCNRRNDVDHRIAHVAHLDEQIVIADGNLAPRQAADSRLDGDCRAGGQTWYGRHRR